MSEPKPEPAVHLTPTAVALRVESAPTKAPDFQLDAPRNASRQHVSYAVTTITAVDMYTAEAMKRVSDNNVACVRIAARSKIAEHIYVLGLAAILSGTLLLLTYMTNNGLHPAIAWAFGTLCAVFGGVVAVREVVAAKKPSELPPIKSDQE